MTLAEYSMAAFAVLNSARVAAYVPQLWCIYRDENRAAAVSVLTWSLFASANLATVTYTWTVTQDTVVAAMFALNAIGCLAIAALTAAKRLRARFATS